MALTSSSRSFRENPSTGDVSVIVPTYHRPTILAQTLEALLRCDFPSSRFEAIVVDDGCDRATGEVVASLRPRWPNLRYHRPTRHGAAAARNLGARLARHHTLVFIDDDIVVKPDFLGTLLHSLTEFAPCAVNVRWEFAPSLVTVLESTPFGRYRLDIEKWVKTGLGRTRIDDQYFEVEGVTACNLAVLREDFWRIGGFDESFPHAGAEDQEFSLRAREAGLRLILDNGHEVWHNDHRLTAQEFCDRQRRGATSALYLAAKYPATHSNRPLITENVPIRRVDPPKTIAKKAVKLLMSTPPVERVLFKAVDALERLVPASRLLQRLYWGLFGLSIFRGVRDGVRQLDPESRRRLGLETS